MKRLDLQGIKEVELNILINFKKLCEDNNLYYTLCGGTLLGAIRHKGFIPWDDDVDVMMPRPDYDRLLNNVDLDTSSLPDYIQISRWTDGSSTYPFIKITDTRTQVKVEYVNKEKNVQGLWIDVFPLDGNPVEESKLNRLQGRALFFRRILLLRMAQNGEGKSAIKRLLKPLIKIPLSLFNMRWLCKKIDDISRTYNFSQSTFAGCVVWGYGPKERIHKEAFMTPIEVEFEGNLFNAPSNYDEYLSGLYGDYMKIPPEDKRMYHVTEAYELNS